MGRHIYPSEPVTSYREARKHARLCGFVGEGCILLLLRIATIAVYASARSRMAEHAKFVRRGAVQQMRILNPNRPLDVKSCVSGFCARPEKAPRPPPACTCPYSLPNISDRCVGHDLLLGPILALQEGLACSCRSSWSHFWHDQVY